MQLIHKLSSQKYVFVALGLLSNNHRQHHVPHQTHTYMRLSTTPVTAAQARSRDKSDQNCTCRAGQGQGHSSAFQQRLACQDLLHPFLTHSNQHLCTFQSKFHLLVHTGCNLLIGYGHVLRGWSEHTLHEGALPLQVVVHWGGHGQVSKAAEVCIGAVQQVVQTLAALQSCNQTSRTATATDSFPSLYLHTLVVDPPVAWPNHSVVVGNQPSGIGSLSYRTGDAV